MSALLVLFFVFASGLSAEEVKPTPAESDLLQAVAANRTQMEAIETERRGLRRELDAAEAKGDGEQAQRMNEELAVRDLRMRQLMEDGLLLQSSLGPYYARKAAAQARERGAEQPKS